MKYSTYIGSGSSSVSTASPTSLTTPDLPSLETACGALTEFVKDNEDTSLECVTNQGCDGLVCSLSALVKMEVIVLPCNDPPGISLKITYLGKVVFDQIVTYDLEATTAPGKLTVTLTQLENAISVEVCAITFSPLLCNISAVLAKEWRGQAPLCRNSFSYVKRHSCKTGF